MLLIQNYAILVLRHLRVVGGNTRVELGLGTGMRDNTRAGPFRDRRVVSTHGTWVWRAAWTSCGFGACFWHAAWKRRVLLARGHRVGLARVVGASRGRRVGLARVFGAPRGKGAWDWRVFLARRVDAAWKRRPSAGLSLLSDTI